MLQLYRLDNGVKLGGVVWCGGNPN